MLDLLKVNDRLIDCDDWRPNPDSCSQIFCHEILHDLSKSLKEDNDKVGSDLP